MTRRDLAGAVQLVILAIVGAMRKIAFGLAALSICGTGLFAAPLTLGEYLQAASDQDPTLQETRYKRELQRIKKDELVHEAILPKFELTLGFGPYPGVREGKYYTDADGTIRQGRDEYDFTTYAPMFATELEAVQPLNFGRLRLGRRALEAGGKVEEWKIRKSELEREAELQSYWYGRLYALDMQNLLKDARRQFDKLLDKVEEMLDEGDESVSQLDLLELKTNLHALREGEAQAASGLRNAESALRFALGDSLGADFAPADTQLAIRPEPLPPFEVLAQAVGERHPEYKQLESGLEARRRQVDVAAANLGPDFFLFGRLQYSTLWAREGDEHFSRDQTDDVDGALGIGMRLRLNFWKGNDKLKKQKWELGALERKASYAKNGLETLLRTQYETVVAQKETAESAAEALRVSDSWLKGAAMRYDIDPSEGGLLVKAFSNWVKMRQTWAKAVHAYNCSYAKLMAAAGVPYSEYGTFGSAKP